MRTKCVSGLLLAVALVAITSFAAVAADVPLVEAVKQGNASLVRSLLDQHVDVNMPQADGTTALGWAAQQDDVETAELLIRAGAKVNAANDYGATPLWMACANGNAAMVETLLKAGADPNTHI